MPQVSVAGLRILGQSAARHLPYLKQRCAVSDELGVDQRPADVEVVVMPAEIDVSNAGMVREALLAALLRGVAIIIADLTPTVFCDCAGAAALVAAARQAVRQDAELRVVAGAGQPWRLFQLTQIADRLALYPTAAAAQGLPDPAETVP
jgi:anti-anti-sigma factor